MKIFKKVISILMASVMAITAFAVTSSAASIEDTAVKITSGKTYSHTFAGKYHEDRADYKIVSNGKGKLSIKLNATNEYVIFELFDSNFNTVDVASTAVTTGSIENGGEGYEYVTYYWNRTGEKIVSTTTWNIKKGTYYLRVGNCYYKGTSSGVTFSGKTKITPTFPSSSSSSSAKISYLSLTIPKNSSIQLGAILSAKSSSSVKWSSSKSSVASVSSKGKVTAKKKGSAVITAKLGSSSIKIKINVK